MMSELVRREERGRLSGIGTAVGYVGTIVGLILVFPFFSGAVPVLGALPAGFMNALRAIVPYTSRGGRVSTFVPTALLFLLFSLPLFLFCKHHEPRHGRVGSKAFNAFREGGRTLKDPRRYPGVLRFILGSFLCQEAIGTIISLLPLHSVQAMRFAKGA